MLFHAQSSSLARHRGRSSRTVVIFRSFFCGSPPGDEINSLVAAAADFESPSALAAVDVIVKSSSLVQSRERKRRETRTEGRTSLIRFQLKGHGECLRTEIQVLSYSKGQRERERERK